MDPCTRSSSTLNWTTHVLGYSVQGNPIKFWAGLPHGRKFEGLDNPLHTPSPVDALFIGAFHGDEPYSAQLLTQWLSELEAESCQIQASVLVIPVFNPDGLAMNTRTNANQVDLNRNFPTTYPGHSWQCGGQETPYFSGVAPASEPETQLMCKLLTQYPPRVIVSVHTPYRVINYDGPAEALAETMGQACDYPVTADIGYPTPGSFGAYTGKERHIPTITLELEEDIPFKLVYTQVKPALEAVLNYITIESPLTIL